MKTDSAFVQGLDSDDSEKAELSFKVAKAICILADSLDIDICATNVSTQGQLSKLLELGINRTQGDIHSTALASKSVGSHIKNYTSKQG